MLAFRQHAHSAGGGAGRPSSLHQKIDSRHSHSHARTPIASTTAIPRLSASFSASKVVAGGVISFADGCGHFVFGGEGGALALVAEERIAASMYSPRL